MSKRLLRRGATVSSVTLLSRLLGFVRDVLFAQFFGASAAFDAFTIAFKLPNFMRRLFGEGAFSQAFVPVLAGKRQHSEPDEVHKFISNIATLLSLVLVVVVLLAEAGAPWLIHLFAPGFQSDSVRFHHAVHLLHWTFPYLFFIALVAFASAVMNTFKRFALAAFAPVLLNVCFIVSLYIAVALDYRHIQVLAYAVLVAGILQFALLAIGLRRMRLMPSLKFHFWRDAAVRRVLKLMVPAIFGVSVAQIGILIDNIFASYLQVGSISWLYYSDRLTYLPLGVIGVALSTVILPHLSTQASKKNHKAFSHTLSWALRMNCLMGIPAAVGLGVLAGPIIATLLGHGAFNAFAVRMTSHSLIAFSIGLPAFMLIKSGASGFYARQKIATVVRIAAMAVVINIVFNFILVGPLVHAGLALATSIAAIVNASCLWILLYSRKIMELDRATKQVCFAVCLAAIVMGFVLYFSSGVWSAWLALSTGERCIHLLGQLCLGIFCYVVVLFIFGVRLHHMMAPESTSE